MMSAFTVMGEENRPPISFSTQNAGLKLHHKRVGLCSGTFSAPAHVRCGPAHPYQQVKIPLDSLKIQSLAYFFQNRTEMIRG